MKREVSDERALQYANPNPNDPDNTGIIAFLGDQYILPETRKPIVLEDWQKEWILKPLFYNLDENGLRKYNIALIGLPKKNGKSAFAAGIGVYFMYAGEFYGEIIVAANARDQASKIIYTKMQRSVNMNPTLRSVTPPLKELLEVKSTGTTARCVAHQYETAAGLNPNLTIFDELWAFVGRRFYDELTVVPTRKEPLVVIVTYAGYEQEGLLWDLYSDGMAGETILETGDPDVVVKRGLKDPRMFMLWSNKNLASWVTKKYLDSQRGRMPPDVYARLHENRWIAAGSKFVTSEDIMALYRLPWLLQTAPRTDRPIHHIVANDLGLSHDRAARVVGHFDPVDLNIYVDSIRLWQGTPEEHVDIEAVEQDLVECAHTFKARQLVVDPWQMEYVIQRLKGTYNVVPFNFTADIQHLSQLLVNMLRSHRIICYHEPALERELKDLIIKQTVAGWRIDHTGRRKNDIVVAIGMMMVEAIKAQYGMMSLPGDDEFVADPLGFKNIRNLEF